MPLPAEIVQALVRAIELKDLATAAHTWRVVLYSRARAEHFGLDADSISRLSVAAALHDLGKIDVPDVVLQKPGRLTAEEFEIVKTHTTAGHSRLVAMGEDDPLVLELVRHHHERVDGKGYPDGLKGEATSAAARYFSVVDSFDALTSVRPYRHEIGPEAERAALRELRDGIGTRYCAESVEAFAKLYESGRMSWIPENFNDRCEVPAFRGEAEVREAHRSLRKR
jgi:HD-GYP domain-containing protein (c-di-GMP phosphodiesterase class II)